MYAYILVTTLHYHNIKLQLQNIHRIRSKTAKFIILILINIMISTLINYSLRAYTFHTLHLNFKFLFINKKIMPFFKPPVNTIIVSHLKLLLQHIFLSMIQLFFLNSTIILSVRYSIIPNF